MPYRGKPIAEGGFIPSQIGAGEAQVFQPVDTSFLEKSVLQERELGLAREKMAAAQQQAQAKAQAKSDLDKEKKQAKDLEKLEQEYKGLPPKSKGEIHKMATKVYDWYIENADRAGDPGFQQEFYEQVESINQLTSTLEDEWKQVGVWEAMKEGKEKTKFKNEEMLSQLYTKKFYTGMAEDPVAFGEKLGKVMTSVRPIEVFDTLGWGSGVASKVKGGYISSGLGVWNEELQKMVVTDSYNEKKHDEDIKAVVKEDFNNPTLTVKEYWTDRYGDDALEKAQKYAITLKTPVQTKKTFVGAAKAKGRTGYNRGGGYGEAGGFRYTPSVIQIEGKEREVKPAEEGGIFNWWPAEEQVIEEGTPSREVIEYPVGSVEETKTVTKRIPLLDPSDPEKEKRITAKVTAFRKDGDDWFVTFKHKKKRGRGMVEMDSKILLSDVATQIKTEYGITMDLLEEWEGQRLSGGSTAPRTTGGTQPSFQ